MSPDQQRLYDRVYPRLMELTDKEDRGLITDEELREQQQLARELETLMNQISPYPPSQQF
jgi:hypothetical protein